MKFFNDVVIAKLKQQYGSEPIIVVSVNWGSTFFIDNLSPFNSHYTDEEIDIIIKVGKSRNLFRFYADKDIYSETGSVLIPGKLLDISNIESAVNFESNNTTSQVTVTIDDSDGSILNVLQTSPIHLKPAYVYLTFEGFHLSDMILLFEGVIVSEFAWSEKDMTVTFNFLSRVEEKEVGFAPEQGYIQDLPLEMIGRPWPFGFGDIIKYPALRINYTPAAVTTDPVGLHDPSLDVNHSRLEAIRAAASGTAEADFKGALQAYFSGLTELGDQLTELGNQALAIVQQVETDDASLQQILFEQILWQHGLDILGGQSGFVDAISDVPVKLVGLFELGELVIRGALLPASGRTAKFRIDSIIHPIPGTTTWGNDYFPPQKEDFVFVNAGTPIKYLGQYPLRYLVNTLGGSVQGVFAYRSFEGLKRLQPVPKKYWKVIRLRTVPPGVRTTVPTFAALAIELKQPLSTLRNQFWDDELYVSYTSTVGPDLKEILLFLIYTYTHYRIDPFTFNSRVPNNTCSFVLPDQKDVMAVIKDLCFQNKIAIWLSEGVFYFAYLPAAPAGRMIIDLANIVQDSVEISISPTENIITKMRGSWRPTYEFDTRNYVAIRYNDDVYGVRPLDVDFYCFNDPSSVLSAMTFWIYRKGNVWKRIKMELPLFYVQIEVFDNILLTREVVDKYKLGDLKEAPYLFVAVIGVHFNPKSFTVTVEVELPVYIGGKIVSPGYWMDLAYGTFLWQIDAKYSLTETPKQTAFYERGFTIAAALEGARLQSDFFEAISSRISTSGALPSPNSMNGDPKQPGFDQWAVTDVGTRINNYSSKRIDFPQQEKQFALADRPAWQYIYGLYNTGTPSSPGGGGSIPGQVQEKVKDNIYNATIYPEGIDSKRTEKIKARILQIEKNETVPKGTWALFSKVSGAAGSEYYFQIAVWMA